MVRKKVCDRCKREIENKKDFHKVRGENLCTSCYKKNLARRRKENMKESELEEFEKKLKERSIKIKEKKQKVEIDKDYQPKIKGSKQEAQEKKRGKKSYSYLSFHDKQALLRILMKTHGLDFESAKDRINYIVEEQKKIRDDFKKKGKSEEDIKQKQKEALEELWNC